MSNSRDQYEFVPSGGSSGALALGPYDAYIAKSNNDTIAVATIYAGITIDFDTKIYDPSNSFDLATDTYTCPVNGIYLFEVTTYLEPTYGGGVTTSPDIGVILSLTQSSYVIGDAGDYGNYIADGTRINDIIVPKNFSPRTIFHSYQDAGDQISTTLYARTQDRGTGVAPSTKITGWQLDGGYTEFVARLIGALTYP